MAQMTLENAARVTREFWRASGERSLHRLGSLAEHIARTYAMDAGEVYVAARDGIYPHELRAAPSNRSLAEEGR